MTFNVLSYLDGIGLDWLGLLRALLSARWILHGDKRTLAGEAQFPCLTDGALRLRVFVIVLQYSKANLPGLRCAV